MITCTHGPHDHTRTRRPEGAPAPPWPLADKGRTVAGRLPTPSTVRSRAFDTSYGLYTLTVKLAKPEDAEQLDDGSAIWEHPKFTTIEWASFALVFSTCDETL
jgi:hypothetical protein